LRLPYFLLGIGIICQLAGEVGIIGTQIEVPVPTVSYQDGLRFAFLLAFDSLFNATNIPELLS